MLMDGVTKPCVCGAIAWKVSPKVVQVYLFVTLVVVDCIFLFQVGHIL